MENFTKSATDTTPLLMLDAGLGEFVIEGKSIPSDAEGFYGPVLNWLNEYVDKPNLKTTLVLKLDYFNISSSKRILFIFYKLNELIDAGHQVNVKWYFHEGEDDMHEVGQDFAFMVNIPFEFIEYSHYESLAG
ncbi:DUF1987 domain-containing protein [Flavobacteriales bacterium]|nr:DUF1987 domain-containing protein [Flavobacteriales bacterium]